MSFGRHGQDMTAQLSKHPEVAVEFFGFLSGDHFLRNIS
jgi:hypothetical protein